MFTSTIHHVFLDGCGGDGERESSERFQVEVVSLKVTCS